MTGGRDRTRALAQLIDTNGSGSDDAPPSRERLSTMDASRSPSGKAAINQPRFSTIVSTWLSLYTSCMDDLPGSTPTSDWVQEYITALEHALSDCLVVINTSEASALNAQARGILAERLLALRKYRQPDHQYRLSPPV